MKSNTFCSARNILTLVSATGLSGMVLATTAPSLPKHLSGLINDYSPAHVAAVPVKGGPYEMRGRWSLHLHDRATAATFSAAMNMETTDAGNVSQDDPTTRGAHTHHITMEGQVNLDTSACPASDPANPPITWRFLVSGPAQITGNGNVAPFQMKGGLSTLQVCVGGGKDGTLEFSNITLVFGAPANTHFGPQPVHGVVNKCGWGWEEASVDCTLTW
jgi:hypothetical protein